jgi:mono/diheme cytochrome c family protein
MRCARCHGAKGDGNGQEADFYDPRPRDFTLGMFKFRTTSTGALPTDSDLFLTISRGISGTAMPSWEGLPEQMRWALVDYIKTFADDFSDLELDPSKFVVTLPPKVASSAESIAKGKALFEKNKCWECHGKEARGDGRTNLKDDWDFPARVPNLTRVWNLKGGSDAKDIVYRFTTGLNGSAMPSFEDSIEGNDRWHLANYVASIAKTGFNRERIIKAEWTEKTIPLKVDDEIWRGLEATQIFMENQTMATPRWINRAIDMLELKVLYNRDKIAFLIEWDDPVQDLLHDKAQEVRTFRDQYARAVGEMPREPGVFRDAIALQFPVSSTLGRRCRPFLEVRIIL